MALPPDYHLHTPLCRHAVGSPAELAARALRLGFREIGFSDHSPMPRDDFDDWRMKAAELDQYVGLVREARRAHPRLEIKLALEVDYLPGCEEWVRELAARHPWDYFIGSVHYVWGGWAIDNPAQRGAWKEHDPLEVWTGYFERLAMAAESGLFDILGHADLCKKFCYYPKEDCSPLYDRLLRAAAGRGVALELNTGGLRKECREIYPGLRLLQRAAQAGVPITFGSDAHAPDEVGSHFDQAVHLARAAGYSHYCGFSRRRREMREL